MLMITDQTLHIGWNVSAMFAYANSFTQDAQLASNCKEMSLPQQACHTFRL